MTGPVSVNMEEALKRTFERAVPYFKTPLLQLEIVALVRIFGKSYASRGACLFQSTIP